MTNAILVDEPSRYDIILPPPLTGVVPRNRYIATMMAMATIIVCDVVCEFVGGQAFGGLIPPIFEGKLKSQVFLFVSLAILVAIAAEELELNIIDDAFAVFLLSIEFAIVLAAMTPCRRNRVVCEIGFEFRYLIMYICICGLCTFIRLFIYYDFYYGLHRSSQWLSYCPHYYSHHQ